MMHNIEMHGSQYHFYDSKIYKLKLNENSHFLTIKTVKTKSSDQLPDRY